MLRKTVFILLVTILSLYATVDTAITHFTDNVISALNLSPTSTLSLSTLEKDKNYLLDLSAVYELIREDFAQKLRGDRVQFTSLDGTSSTVMYDLLSTNMGGASRVLKELDTLILSGECHIVSDSQLYCTILLSTTSARTVASTTLQLNKKSATPSLFATLFLPLSNRSSYEDVLYRGRIIRAFEKMVHSTEANFFYAPAQFELVLVNPYAKRRQLDILKEILHFRYGVTFVPGSSAKICVGYEGLVTIKRGGESISLANIIDGEPLLPLSYENDISSMRVPVRDIRTESITYEEQEVGLKNSFISDIVAEEFEKKYPRLFSPLQVSKLKALFQNKENSILVGSLTKSDHATGIEHVVYRWSSAQAWIQRLEQLQRRGRTFKVQTQLMKIFRDEVSTERFWAVIKQEWATQYAANITYEDVGFLIVNFDFNLLEKRLVDFQIAYRLWFYNYKYREIETGIGRVGKLKRDLTDYFLDSHQGVSGISESLKSEIVTFILQKADEVESTLIMQ